MIQDLVTHSAGHRDVVARRGLRFMRSVSAPLPPSLMSEFEQIFGIPVVEIFGMTETAGVITSNPLPPRRRIAGSVGLSAGPEIRILDSEGRECPSGATGEVVTRGENLMAGYLDAPGSTPFVEGWFRTGDLGHLDPDGYLFLTGRLKDMINRGGEKVSPHEVDEAIRSHPAVADAATFPVPDPALGEEVAAAIVRRPGHSLSDQEMVSFLQDRLTYFKIPRQIRFVDSVPRGANGKLRRAELAGILGITPDRSASGRREYRAPSTPIGAHLCRTWSDPVTTLPTRKAPRTPRCRRHSSISAARPGLSAEASTCRRRRSRR